jgi:hypothetical protein
MAHLLHQMATDLSDSSQFNMLLCQILATTYSPFFISQSEVLPALLLAMVSTRLDDSLRPLFCFRLLLSHPGSVSREEKAPDAYTAMVSKYLIASHLRKQESNWIRGIVNASRGSVC